NQAAGWLAFATLIKGYPLALALLVAALYPRRFFFRYGIALACGLLLPFAVQRTDLVAAQYASWLTHLRESTVIMRERLRTLEHLFALYAHPMSPQSFQLVQLFAGVAVLALCRISALRRPEQSGQLQGALTLFACWVILFGPATEACTYIVIAPVIAAALVETFSRPASWVCRSVLIGSFLLMGPLVTDFVPPAIRNYASEHGSQPIGGLLFLGSTLVQMTKAGRVCYPTELDPTSRVRPAHDVAACL